MPFVIHTLPSKFPLLNGQQRGKAARHFHFFGQLPSLNRSSQRPLPLFRLTVPLLFVPPTVSIA
jgi:hypothetical protein